MPPIDDQMAEIIKGSISLEVNGKRFYERAASVTDDKLGKAMFQRLAEEEDGHLEVLEGIFASITDGDDWREIAERAANRTGRAPVVEQLETAIAARGKDQNANDSKALKIAMEMERKAIWFFEEMIKRAKSPKMRELVEALADEERFHYDLLQSQLDNLMNVGLWYDSTDLRMDSKF